ncbi:SDR family NAD(P)-dependent oxidoreductase [Streptomyces sp. NPDC059970]|uniref:SDR family NAD(P)-dependent oxidoreductase n=1 Tax=Streptomyces sp. NPDC059970 TaxID=3347019 RepID=UPI00367D6F84
MNVLSAVRMIRTCLPAMKDRSWGRILNIASDSAVVTPVEMAGVAASNPAGRSAAPVAEGPARAAVLLPVPVLACGAGAESVAQ